MCFGAGAAMPVLPSLIFGEVKHSPPVESAARPAAPAQVTAEAPKPTEPKVTEKPVDPTPPPPVQNAVPVRDSAELAGGPNETAPPPLNAPAANQSAPVAKESVGSGAAARAAPEAAAPARSQEERPAPRNRRAAQRDNAAQVRAADIGAVADDVTGAGTANANAPNANSGERRVDRDTNRGSSRRRERTAEYGRGSGSWERWRGEEPEQAFGERGWGERSSSDRASSDRSWRWGRDRDDDERGEDRRAFRRAAREDGRLIGRGPRFGWPGFFLLGGED